MTEPEYIKVLLQNDLIGKQTALGKAYVENEIQCLVFPQDIGCSFGVAAGYPSVTVQAGYTEKGEPFAITFSVRAYSEKHLIQYAYAFEQTIKARRKPNFKMGSH